MSELLPVLEAMVAERDAGRDCVLCALVGKKGSAPQAPGATMLVRGDRTTIGTLGGGCVEAEVIRRAYEEFLDSPGAAPRLMPFVLDHDWGWDDGLICGGRMEIGVMPIGPAFDLAPFRRAIDEARAQREAWFPVSVENDAGQRIEYRVQMEAPPTLLIAGAGHVGQALARIAVDLDFRVVVFDDRADCASRERFGPRVELIVESIPAAMARWEVDLNSYVVIVTRGHNNDERALEAVIRKPAAYIGLIGSARKRRMIFDDLEKQGVSRERLEAVHSPVGLAIGAVTVPEIAVSIAAELVKHRRRTPPVLVEAPCIVAGPAGA